MAYQPKSYKKFVATAATATLVASAVVPTALAASFTDVSSNYKVAVDYLVSEKITEGINDTKFGTDNNIKRGDAAIFIAKALNLNTTTAPDQDFTDVNSRVEGAVNAIVAAGIASGKTESTFAPDDYITRAEMAKILVNAYELKAGDTKNTFTDVNSNWDGFVDALVASGVTLGLSETYFGATENVTRGQFALFIYRAEVAPETPGETPGTPVPVELDITSVTALNDANSFLEIKFSKAVSKLEISDILIKDAKSGATYGVKAVTLSSDGKNATVELYSHDDANREKPVLRYLTDYNVTVKANGDTLEYSFNRPAFVEQRVTEVNFDDRKITLEGVGTLEVLESVEIDFEEAKGRTILVWYNKDREVVKYLYDEKETVIYSDIQLDKVDVIKTLEDGKGYDISDKEFTFNVNDEEVDYEDYRAAGIEGNKDPELDFAKVILGSNGEVEYVSAYTFTNYSVVASVDTKGEQIVGATGTSSISDAADYLIIKDGKQVSYEDLKAGDVVLYNADAYNEDGFAVVYNKTVTGDIETVYEDSLVVNGKEYDFIRDTYYAGNMSGAKFLDEDGEYKTVTMDDVEDLQDGGEVTLYLDAKGDLLLISGQMEATVADVAVLTENVLVDTSYGKASLQLEALFANKTEKLYDVQLDNLDKITINGIEYDIDDASDRDADEYKPTLDAAKTKIVLTPRTGAVIEIPLTDLSKGALVEFGFNSNGSLDELKLFTDTLTAGQDEAYSVINITSPNTGGDELLESGDNYAVTENGAKKLKDNTVIFDATKGSSVSYDASDITITTWKEYNGSDISNARVLYDDDNEVTAIVIEKKVSNDNVFEEAVITKVSRNTDGELVSIEAYINGVKKTIAADKLDDANADALAKGDVALLTFDKGKTDLVKDVEIDGRTVKNLVVDTVDTGKREVKFTNGVTYKLSNDGAILDGRNNDDIKVEAFADLVGKNNVTVVLDEATGTFAKYFVIEPNTSNPVPNPDVTAPAVPSITSSTVTGNTVTVSGIAEAGSTVAVIIDADKDGVVDDGEATTTAIANATTGSYSVATGTLTVGSHDLLVTATDAANNVSVTAKTTITVEAVVQTEVKLSDLSPLVLQSVPGVYAVKFDLAKVAEAIGADANSTLAAAVPGKEDITFTYNATQDVFYNANIQGYSEAEINASIVSVR